MTTKEKTDTWHVLDAAKKPLGRLSTEAAILLMGKHLADFAPNRVPSVYVVIINTDSIVVTGDKMNQKKYYRYSGYSGGLSTRTMKEQMQRDSRKIVEAAVSGMLPKNLLRSVRLGHLKLYKDSEHPHLPQTNNPGRPASLLEGAGQHQGWVDGQSGGSATSTNRPFIPASNLPADRQSGGALSATNKPS